jgi:transcriptional regulator with XRE-family HTH domain
MARRRRARGIRYPDLATYLAESGDTQARMAAHLGISQASISRIKDGKVLPSADIAERLAAYAGIPLDSFYRVQLLKRGVA